MNHPVTMLVYDSLPPETSSKYFLADDAFESRVKFSPFISWSRYAFVTPGWAVCASVLVATPSAFVTGKSIMTAKPTTVPSVGEDGGAPSLGRFPSAPSEDSILARARAFSSRQRRRVPNSRSSSSMRRMRSSAADCEVSRRWRGMSARSALSASVSSPTTMPVETSAPVASSFRA